MSMATGTAMEAGATATATAAMDTRASCPPSTPSWLQTTMRTTRDLHLRRLILSVAMTSTRTARPEGSLPSQMNMRGVFLHVLSDALGSVIVIISALVVWLTEWEYSKYIDPALSLGLVTLITCSTWPLLKDSALILLQTVPTHIQVDGIQKQLLNVDGVLAVHEFHVWQLAGERIIASAHIRCRNLKDYMVLAEKIKKMFHEEGIHSTTIQPEFVEYEDDGASASIDSAEDCILDCPSKDKDGCVANTCCGLSKQNDVSPLVSSCRQRNSIEVHIDTQGENIADGAMEGGYLLVPTSVNHVSSV
ncbi:zinc transporter 1-like [Penaeus japonicus]|uniref:zinc transporter 1-like n=1 Tax=Penaeus japonicus TaxID=27405 RepID=UPI001C710EA3|nr:zinc transporter 1-like [Penaeus japonicus]